LSSLNLKNDEVCLPSIRCVETIQEYVEVGTCRVVVAVDDHGVCRRGLDEHGVSESVEFDDCGSNIRLVVCDPEQVVVVVSRDRHDQSAVDPVERIAIRLQSSSWSSGPRSRFPTPSTGRSTRDSKPSPATRKSSAHRLFPPRPRSTGTPSGTQ